MLDLEMDRLLITDTEVEDMNEQSEQDELSLEDLEDVAGGGCGITINFNF